MTLRVATWNINSVRLRAEQAARFAQESGIDVLCLQEIKCRDGEFPAAAFIDAGLPHLKIKGQKGWHGVAIASRLPIQAAPLLDLCKRGEARAVSGVVAGVEIQNFYIPAGGDVADPAVNPKFEHKLDFFARLAAETARRNPKAPLLIAGDLNVAPGEHDVWNHRYMSKVVSHTPVEIAAMESVRTSLGFIDLVRRAIPDPEKLFSWWSYRALDFRMSNRGLRLDHLWASPGLAETFAGAARVHDDVRDWTRPSDHAPVSADLAI
jgi:exodeoxyribonuclease-3